jgi:L-threonylcarbamoyladenylate synthase
MHVNESFPQQTLTILDGGRCTVGIESTIVDASNPETYQILRHGLIDEQAIAKVIATLSSNQQNNLRVPGKLDSHYQPHKTLYYFAGYDALAQYCQQSGNSIYAIASKQPSNVAAGHYHQLADNPEQAAFDLYYQLRQADASSAQCIVIELPPATGMWQGVRERILKAGVPYSSL